MATASAAHLRNITTPVSSVHAGASRSSRLPDLPDSTVSSRNSSKPSAKFGSFTPPALASLPQEDRDAALTGSTRSLARRLFALNLHAQAAQPIPAMPHRPGSVLLRSA